MVLRLFKKKGKKKEKIFFSLRKGTPPYNFEFFYFFFFNYYFLNNLPGKAPALWAREGAGSFPSLSACCIQAR